MQNPHLILCFNSLPKEWAMGLAVHISWFIRNKILPGSGPCLQLPVHSPCSAACFSSLLHPLYLRGPLSPSHSTPNLTITSSSLEFSWALTTPRLCSLKSFLTSHVGLKIPPEYSHNALHISLSLHVTNPLFDKYLFIYLSLLLSINFWKAGIGQGRCSINGFLNCHWLW